MQSISCVISNRIQGNRLRATIELNGRKSAEYRGSESGVAGEELEWYYAGLVARAIEPTTRYGGVAQW